MNSVMQRFVFRFLSRPVGHETFIYPAQVCGVGVS